MNTPTQQTGGELPTPRTDEAQILASFNEVEPPHYPRAFLAVTADHARQLERETATLHAQLGEARAECLEQARLNGMGAEREAALLGQIARLQQREGELRAALEENTGRLAFMTGAFRPHLRPEDVKANTDAFLSARAALQSVAKEGEQ